MADHVSVYNDKLPQKLTDDVFSGQFTLEQALQHLRKRLLDLSPRNRLLNYRYPKGRCIQFVDSPNINLVYERLIDSNRSVLIKYVPEPDPHSYQLKRPEVKEHADSLGIDISTEFNVACCGSTQHKHAPKLQALFYPAELEKICRRISADARMSIEETGSNMLYLMVGFLEFYENDCSERPLLAPLLAVPVFLEKGSLDKESRTYQYSILYSGEDVHVNYTLREKLAQDFGLYLPELGDEDLPGDYLKKVALAIKNIKRWKVRHQLTLGFLSFGKLAVWEDLNPKKWPGLTKNALLQEVFSGSSNIGSALFAEDYNIDGLPNGDVPLIFDADSSQHSAIVDVLSGKNMVINGPPGTGKSQTITNIIATALKEGKTVLFVSEKLAALEVVRRRLNQAHLGQFCLELHSHKTQKKKLLADIQERINQTFRAPQQLQAKLSTLAQRRSQLNRYSELMNSYLGNDLGITAHDIFWRTERYRQVIGDLASKVQSLFLPEATKWTYDDIEKRRGKLQILGQLFGDSGAYDESHPWWGFIPNPLAPGDDEAIGNIINRSLAIATELNNEIEEYKTFLKDASPISVQDIVHQQRLLSLVPEPPDSLILELLPKFFSDNDLYGEKSEEVIDSVCSSIEQLRKLKDVIELFLKPDFKIIDPQSFFDISSRSEKILPDALQNDLKTFKQKTEDLTKSLDTFKAISDKVSFAFCSIKEDTLDQFYSLIAPFNNLGLSDAPVKELTMYSHAITEAVSRVKNSLGNLKEIAHHLNGSFDGTPDAVDRLSRQDFLQEIRSHVKIDQTVIEEVQKASKSFLSEHSLNDINRRQRCLQEAGNQIFQIVHELKTVASQLKLPFSDTRRSIAGLMAMAGIAETAPKELLAHRSNSLANPGLNEVIERAENEQKEEFALRNELEELFFLDALPEVQELKKAVQIFRQGDRLFAFLNKERREAKRIFAGICKQKTKRKAFECAEFISRIIKWQDISNSYVCNGEYREIFGSLFNGLDTNFDKIRRLYTWYTQSYKEILLHPCLSDCIDLFGLDSHQIQRIEASAPRIRALESQLEVCMKNVQEHSNGEIPFLDTLDERSLSEYSEHVQNVANDLKNIVELLGMYVNDSVSPSRAVTLLKGKLALSKADPDFQTVRNGKDIIQEAGGQLFRNALSVSFHIWDEYFHEIDLCMKKVNELCSFVLTFTTQDISPEDARLFISSKMDLDSSLSSLAFLPDSASFDCWNDYIKFADGVRNDAQSVVLLLEPLGLPDKSINNVISGLESAFEYDAILNNLNSDDVIKSIFDGFIDGCETRINAFRDTYEWGNQIALKKCSSFPQSLAKRLLSQDATDALTLVKNKLSIIIELFEKVRSELLQLTQYGTFGWNRWIEPYGDVDDQCYSDNLTLRLLTTAENIGSVLPLSKYVTEKKECEKLGLGDLVAGLEALKIPPDQLGAVFDYITYRSIGRHIYRTVSGFSQFSGASHEKIREDFINLDKEIISLNGKNFAYEIDKAKKVPLGERGYRVSELTEMELVYNEIHKQKRHIPIRQLMKRAGRAIQALKPCFMMGPLSVAQYLEQGVINFDIIIMDEASQLKPEEALGAIIRARQVVVVGDPKQLPPTSFFDRMADDGDDEDDDLPAVLSGSDSILDICQQIFRPVRTLRWHYRSNHHSLIAFSNHHFYEEKLLVFPSPFERNMRVGLRFRYIGNGVYRDRQNIPEAQRVVDAIIEHMIKNPGESLGVVTLNLTQRDLIEDIFDKKLRNVKECQKFISLWEENGWPFFIKNLENVQGDERDVVFISTTFGKALGTDKVRQNFGPISRPFGWRRLNVLFTRAKLRIELFTSMQPEDIIVDEKTPAGTQALRDYLDYAKRGELKKTVVGFREPDSDFEVAVGEVIKSKGYEVVPQLGVAGYFIDIAVRNPERPGEYLAAVECDGATYHSGKSARDRDRIRQDILESLGWKDRIWRIWSCDWFYDPRREAERLFQFLERRREISKTEPIIEYIPFEEQRDEDIPPVVEKKRSTEQVILREEGLLGADLFVEIGDQVTYCFADNPKDKHTVMIVDSPSNTRLNLLNERTPVAQALLDLSIGEENELLFPDGRSRIIKVVKIQRQERLGIT